MGKKVAQNPAALLLLLLSLPLHAGEKFSRTQLLMGDVPVSIVIETSLRKKESAFRAMEEAFAEAKRIEEEVSEWRPVSETSLLNRNAGQWVPVGRDLVEILIKAREISEMTGGAFDITFSSSCRRGKRCPSYRDVIVIPELGLASLRPGVRIDLSGIAKGQIVDRMVATLRDAGFRRFLINAGDIYASGRWEVGIRDPENRSGPPICRLQVKDQAVSTSGPYERGPHIIDPRTRLPARAFKSVTVIARSSALADALATGGFVMGKDALQGLVERVSGIVRIGAGGKAGTAGKVSALCRWRFN